MSFMGLLFLIVIASSRIGEIGGSIRERGHPSIIAA